MKKNNLKIIKIDKNKTLFNYEKKILIKELVLDLKLGYYDFEKEKPQKVKFNLEVFCFVHGEALVAQKLRKNFAQALIFCHRRHRQFKCWCNA